MTALPPSITVGALYDKLLQGALRHFFDRATFETEPIPSLSSDGRLAIEPTHDPCALSVRWFGTRYLLRVPPRRSFTVHEIRLAGAIGRVLAARYRAIFNPGSMVTDGDLFRGVIEDRFVSAFFDERPYLARDTEASRPDRIASAIEMLRVAALSTYENRTISTGVLLLGDKRKSAEVAVVPAGAQAYTQAATAIRSFHRLCDGLHTLFLVNSQGLVIDIIDIERRARECPTDLSVPCVTAYRAHARATLMGDDVCVVLSPSQEIKVFAEGTHAFAFRHGNWRLLDLKAKYELWAEAVGRELAARLFQTALDLADKRRGALLVLLREPSEALPVLVSRADLLTTSVVDRGSGDVPSRRGLLSLVARRPILELEEGILSALAALDGAVVTDRQGHLLAVGAILRHPPEPQQTDTPVEGARTTAAVAASRFGPVLKVSEDGNLTFYDGERIWDI